MGQNWKRGFMVSTAFKDSITSFFSPHCNLYGSRVALSTALGAAVTWSSQHCSFPPRAMRGRCTPQPSPPPPPHQPLLINKIWEGVGGGEQRKGSSYCLCTCVFHVSCHLLKVTQTVPFISPFFFGVGWGGGGGVLSFHNIFNESPLLFLFCFAFF